jgi:hypothetical protein
MQNAKCKMVFMLFRIHRPAFFILHFAFCIFHFLIFLVHLLSLSDVNDEITQIPDPPSPFPADVPRADAGVESGRLVGR